MLLGDSGVGKTCLLVRFKDDTFLCGSFIATVGIDFRNKTIVINNKQVKLQIYDTVRRTKFSSTRQIIDDEQEHHAGRQIGRERERENESNQSLLCIFILLEAQIENGNEKMWFFSYCRSLWRRKGQEQIINSNIVGNVEERDTLLQINNCSIRTALDVTSLSTLSLSRSWSERKTQDRPERFSCQFSVTRDVWTVEIRRPRWINIWLLTFIMLPMRKETHFLALFVRARWQNETNKRGTNSEDKLT